MHNAQTKFATVSWTAHDVKSIRPDWSLEKCLEALEGIERSMKDTLTQEGWKILDDVLESE